MHDSPQSHRILSSDTAALWLLGLAFIAVHFVAGARYGFHRDELLTYSNAQTTGRPVIPPLKMLALGPIIATLAIWSKRG
jgi:hypothetical protein